MIQIWYGSRATYIILIQGDMIWYDINIIWYSTRHIIILFSYYMTVYGALNPLCPSSRPHSEIWSYQQSKFNSTYRDLPLGSLSCRCRQWSEWPSRYQGSAKGFKMNCFCCFDPNMYWDGSYELLYKPHRNLQRIWCTERGRNILLIYC
jgi:hypothetical protein